MRKNISTIIIFLLVMVITVIQVDRKIIEFNLSRHNERRMERSLLRVGEILSEISSLEKVERSYIESIHLSLSLAKGEILGDLGLESLKIKKGLRISYDILWVMSYDIQRVMSYENITTNRIDAKKELEYFYHDYMLLLPYLSKFESSTNRKSLFKYKEIYIKIRNEKVKEILLAFINEVEKEQ